MMKLYTYRYENEDHSFFTPRSRNGQFIFLSYQQARGHASENIKQGQGNTRFFECEIINYSLSPEKKFDAQHIDIGQHSNGQYWYTSKKNITSQKLIKQVSFSDLNKEHESDEKQSPAKQSRCCTIM